jgi:hypothetical protein
MLLDPGDRARHSTEPTVPDGDLRQTALLLAMERPVVQLSKDERCEHGEVARGIEDPR